MADGIPEATDGSSGRLSQMRFQLGEGHLGRVEVQAVGRKDLEPSAYCFSGSAHNWRLMAGQVIHDDNVAA